MNTPNPKQSRTDKIDALIVANEPYRRCREDPRYAAIVKMLASEMIDGWFDELQLTEAVQLASRRHREYVARHGQRDKRYEMAVELHRHMYEAMYEAIPETREPLRCPVSFPHPPHDFCDGNPDAPPFGGKTP